MQPFKLAALLAALVSMSGCYATKLVSVPMRITGAVASVAPIVGNTAHAAIDEAAEAVDNLP